MAGTDNLWQMYAQQILQIASPKFDPSHQQFSLASSTLSIDIGNADPAIDNAYIYHMGNTIPAASPAYAPGSGLLTAYRLFLDCIDLKGDSNPNLESQINLASSALTAAQTNMGNVQVQAVSAWNAYKVFNPNITIQDYVTQQYPLYTAAKNALRAAQANFDNLMTQRYGAGYEVIAEAHSKVTADGGAADVAVQNPYNMATKSGAVGAAGGVAALPGQTPEGPASALISSFSPAFALDSFTTVYQEWQAASARKAKPAASITLDSSSSGSGWANSGWAAEGEGGFGGFLSVWGEASASQDTQTSFGNSDNYHVQMDFVGLQTFPISAGQWFDLGLLQTFKNQLLPNSPPFFSAGGSLARLPAQAVIGFNPTITLTMSHSDYAKMHSTFQAQATAAVGFGPFTVGSVHSSTYAESSSAQFNDSSGTIVISPPPTTVPVLLGIISSRLDV